MVLLFVFYLINFVLKKLFYGTLNIYVCFDSLIYIYASFECFFLHSDNIRHTKYIEFKHFHKYLFALVYNKFLLSSLPSVA